MIMPHQRAHSRQQAVEMMDMMIQQLEHFRASEGLVKDLESLDRNDREAFWDDHAMIIAYMSIACDRIRATSSIKEPENGVL